MTAESRHREKARRRYWADHSKGSYTCPDCGRSESELRGGFEVHHSDGRPSNNELDNLVALCRPCHNLREGKKPSLNDIRYLRNQLAAEPKLLSLDEVPPVISTMEEYSDYQDDCARRYLPCLNINRIRSSPHARVEFDFILAGGWKVLQIKNGSTHKLGATLSEHAALVCQSILDKYDAKNDSDFSTLSVESGQSYFSTPKLSLDSAKSLAYELAPVVNTRSNWKVPDNDLRLTGDRECRIRLADDLEK